MNSANRQTVLVSLPVEFSDIIHGIEEKYTGTYRIRVSQFMENSVSTHSLLTFWRAVIAVADEYDTLDVHCKVVDGYLTVCLGREETDDEYKGRLDAEYKRTKERMAALEKKRREL
jgi:hypothetical protein